MCGREGGAVGAFSPRPDGPSVPAAVSPSPPNFRRRLGAAGKALEELEAQGGVEAFVAFAAMDRAKAAAILYGNLSPVRLSLLVRPCDSCLTRSGWLSAVRQWLEEMNRIRQAAIVRVCGGGTEAAASGLDLGHTWPKAWLQTVIKLKG